MAVGTGKGACRGTQVYLVRQLPLNAVLQLEETLQELRSRSQRRPLRVQAVFRGELMTVKLRLLDDRTIEFVRSAPQAGKQLQDLEEIVELLEAHGIRTELVQEPAGAVAV